MEKIAFTEEQKKVIDSDSKRLLVLSCAGSGKTATIIGRIQRLLGEGVLSSVFLVLSFSNKSADDIREKLERNIPGAKMTVQTFHSFGLDLIKKYHEELGYDKKIGIAMDSERKNFIKLICFITLEPILDIAIVLLLTSKNIRVIHENSRRTTRHR